MKVVNNINFKLFYNFYSYFIKSKSILLIIELKFLLINNAPMAELATDSKSVNTL